MRLRRPYLLILCALVVIPFAFQNCGMGFLNGGNLALNEKSGGGNGGGYDGKPGSYVLADLGNECANSSATQVAAKQVIVVDDSGQMSRTVRDCQNLPVPEVVRASDLQYNSKSTSAFVESGRFFQKLNVTDQGMVSRTGLTEIFCTWSRGGGRVGEARLNRIVSSAEGPSSPSSGSSLGTDLFEESEAETPSSQRVSVIDNTPVPTSTVTPDPYGDGITRMYQSPAGSTRSLNMSGIFYADRAAEAAVIEIDGETQTNTRCWMVF